MNDKQIDQNILNIVSKIYHDNSRMLGFNGTSKEDFFAWQKKAKNKLIDLLRTSEYKKTPLEMNREIISETDDFIKEKINYYTLKDIKVSAYLLIPKNIKLPAPAILCPPGHGGGMNQLVNEKPVKIEGLTGIYKQYPLELARRGFVVLIPENIGFGERGGKKISDCYYEYGLNHQFLYLSLNLLGKSQIGMMLWELARAIDVMQLLPEVKKDKIGCYGLSLGGELTMLLSAIDNRISVACISGYFSSHKSTYLSGLHCGCGYSYGLAKYFEHIDMAALIAPRPLVIESGRSDETFLIKEAVRSFKALSKIYSLIGSDSNVVHDVFDGGHEISGAVAYDWFVEKLS